jgi:hypothetical protein
MPEKNDCKTLFRNGFINYTVLLLKVDKLSREGPWALVAAAPAKIAKSQVISLAEADINEAALEKLIADDPAILGLGDIVLIERQRPQEHAGRLDLLLEDAEGELRYEVELMLGSLDESHLVRSIEVLGYRTSSLSGLRTSRGDRRRRCYEPISQCHPSVQRIDTDHCDSTQLHQGRRSSNDKFHQAAGQREAAHR